MCKLYCLRVYNNQLMLVEYGVFHRKINTKGNRSWCNFNPAIRRTLKTGRTLWLVAIALRSFRAALIACPADAEPLDRRVLGCRAPFALAL